MLTQKEKNILTFIRPYALEDRKVLMRDNFIDEKIKNMTLEEIRETLVSLGDKGYFNTKVFITDTVMVMEVLQKGLEFDQPKDELDVMPTFSFKRGGYVSEKEEVNLNTSLKENTNTSINADSSLEIVSSAYTKEDYSKSFENNANSIQNTVNKVVEEIPVTKITMPNTPREDFDSSKYYINQNTDYLDIKKMIFSDERISEEDQKILLKLIVLVETMTDSNVPLPKGAFLEYEDVIQKYGWIADVLGRTIVNKYLLANY